MPAAEAEAVWRRIDDATRLRIHGPVIFAPPNAFVLPDTFVPEMVTCALPSAETAISDPVRLPPVIVTTALPPAMMAVAALMSDFVSVSLQLPAAVTLEVIETAPELKGATATKRPKPAKLNTGIEIQVPEYISTGEKIMVSTVTGEFAGRA